jgi:hypothetical protein
VTGTLPTANGGTNLTSFTSGGVVYASSSSALATGSALQFDGNALYLSAAGAKYINLGTTSNGQTVAFQISAPNSDSSASVYRLGSGLTADNEWTVYDVTSTQTVDKYIRGASGFRAFYANGSEGLRLTPSSLYTASAISVGIGTSSPATKLHVSQGAGTAPEIRVTASTVYAKIIADDAVEGMMLIDGFSKIGFKTDGTERARINENGNLKLNNNMSIGGATPTTSGTGITFPATQSASSNANTLDDYEEGTWTPSVGGTSTYTIQKGSYTKVGRLVTVSFDMAINVLGTGNIYAISGLPFTVGNATSPKQESGFGANGYFQDLAVSVYSLTFYAEVSNTNIYAISTSAALGSTTANVNPAIYGNGTRVQGTVTYMASA